MSASFDASFITGVSPNKHKIPGLVWFNAEENRLINYGNTPMATLKLGLRKVFKDIIINQNHKHLSSEVSTLYEDLSDLGYTTGVFSYQLFRGKNNHTISIPWYLKLFLGNSYPEIKGPDTLILGKIVNSLKEKINGPQSIFSRLGINDIYSLNAFLKTIKTEKQPYFSLIYLPKTDQLVHKKYLQGGLEGLIKVDTLLKKVINTFGSLEKTLEKNIFILTSDHSQTKVDKLIYIEKILNKFSFPKLREKITPKHQLILANNERMMYIYYRHDEIKNQIIETLQKEENIDIIACKENNQIKVVSGKVGGELFFSPGKTSKDDLTQKWDISGNKDILDLTEENGRLKYGNYPNALAMLHSALNTTSTPCIVITAQPGAMFMSESAPNYKGGASHGGLHHSKMLVPFIISEKIDIPLPKTQLEFKKFIMKLISNQ